MHESAIAFRIRTRTPDERSLNGAISDTIARRRGNRAAGQDVCEGRRWEPERPATKSLRLLPSGS